MTDNYYEIDDYVRELMKVYPDRKVTIAAKVDVGGLYDWSVAAVYHVDGVDNYYLGEDSGCSCDGYGWDANYDDLDQFTSRKALLSYLFRNHDEYMMKELYADLRAK